MALTHDHRPALTRKEENHCAVIFCLTWLGFFAAIGAITWIVTSL